jgi:hypothetical protein
MLFKSINLVVENDELQRASAAISLRESERDALGIVHALDVAGPGLPVSGWQSLARIAKTHRRICLQLPPDSTAPQASPSGWREIVRRS